MSHPHNDPKVKGWKINPFNRTITPCEWPQSDLDQMHHHLSTPYNTVDCFDHVNMGNGMSMYVDDEGMLSWQAKQQEFFVIHNPEHFRCDLPIAGNAIVCDTDSEGRSVSSTFTHEQLRNCIHWIDHKDLLRRASTGEFDPDIRTDSVGTHVYPLKFE